MSLLAGALGLAGSLWSSQQNQNSANASMAFQKEVLQNRNQWTVNDLKAAGLNPILAAGTTQSTAHGAQAETQNPVEASTRSAASAKQIEVMERQQRNADMLAQSQAELNSAQAAKFDAEATDYGAKLDSGYYPSHVRQMGSSALQSEAYVDFLGSQREEIVQKISESKSRQEQMAEQTRMIRADIAKIADERAELRSRLSLNLSRAEESRTRARLNEIDRIHEGYRISLTNAEKALVDERTRTQKFETDVKEADASLKRLELPYTEQESKSRYEYNRQRGTNFMDIKVPGWRRHISGWR
ncbi:DNA pilot protein [Chifec microvirus UA13_24]|nr:DNA pilot protein [Chifec microvirus UA13_24]